MSRADHLNVGANAQSQNLGEASTYVKSGCQFERFRHAECNMGWALA